MHCTCSRWVQLLRLRESRASVRGHLCNVCLLRCATLSELLVGSWQRQSIAGSHLHGRTASVSTTVAGCTEVVRIQENKPYDTIVVCRVPEDLRLRTGLVAMLVQSRWLRGAAALSASMTLHGAPRAVRTTRANHCILQLDGAYEQEVVMARCIFLHPEHDGICKCACLHLWTTLRVCRA